MKSVNAKELKQKREAGQDFLLVNTLGPESFAKAHIPGSVNIPQDSEDFTEKVENAAGGKESEVIVYCANADCQSSTHAAEKLETAGFTDVGDFEGGVKEWEAAGEELVAGER